MHRWLLPALLLWAAGATAQAELPADTIAARLTGCWYAGDGGMRGYFCFSNAGTVLVRFSGKGREPLEGTWEVDAKGLVTISSGRSRTRYLVERLEADGFVLVTPKEGVRLEGHRDPPKGWK
jgi:hypothetical protein